MHIQLLELAKELTMATGFNIRYSRRVDSSTNVYGNYGVFLVDDENNVILK
jgi:hypothetical protein